MLWLFSAEGVEYLNVFVKAKNSSQLTAEDLERQSRAKTLFPEAEVGLFYAGLDVTPVRD